MNTAVPGMYIVGEMRTQQRQSLPDKTKTAATFFAKCNVSSIFIDHRVLRTKKDVFSAPVCHKLAG